MTSISSLGSSNGPWRLLMRLSCALLETCRAIAPFRPLLAYGRAIRACTSGTCSSVCDARESLALHEAEFFSGIAVDLFARAFGFRGHFAKLLRVLLVLPLRLFFGAAEHFCNCGWVHRGLNNPHDSSNPALQKKRLDHTIFCLRPDGLGSREDSVSGRSATGLLPALRRRRPSRLWALVLFACPERMRASSHSQASIFNYFGGLKCAS